MNIRVGIKDIFCFKDKRTPMGLDSLDLSQNATEDSYIVKLLKSDSRFILSNSITMQFACGTLYPELTYQGLSLGGSSVGTVWDLANDLIDVGVCSDTGGSTIAPSVRHDFWGFKPSYGWCSRQGMIPLCSALDTISLMSKKLEHIEILYDALRKKDSLDSTQLEDRQIHTNKFYIAKNLFEKRELDVLKEMHPEFELKDLELPDAEVLEGAYWYILCPDFYTNMLKFNGLHNIRSEHNLIPYYKISEFKKLRSSNFNEEVKSRILVGSALIKDYDYDPIKILKEKLMAQFEDAIWITPLAESDIKGSDLGQKNNTLRICISNNLVGRPIIAARQNYEVFKRGFVYSGPVNSEVQLISLLKDIYKEDNIVHNEKAL